MDMWILIGGITVGLVILLIGGGFGYFFWISTRTKKMTWKAKVYQLRDGIIPPEKDADGKVISKLSMRDLSPYTHDRVEKVDKGDGSTNYWLVGLKKAVPVVTADCVEVWSNNEKWVHVLLEGDTTTLIKSGYDELTGSRIFKPMPHDRINMIKTEYDERKTRIENTRDILAQITPFVVVGMAMLALVAIVYFQVQGAIKTAELYTESADELRGELHAFRKDVLKATGCFLDENRTITREELPASFDP